MKLTNICRQSRMVMGVCVADGDYDELLREALRVAMRIDTDPVRDNFDECYDRIRALMRAYAESPEGDDAVTMMTRLAASISDVIPRERW